MVDPPDRSFDETWLKDEWFRIEPRVRLYAYKAAQPYKFIWDRAGRPANELECDDLINWVWEKLQSNPDSWDRSSMTLFSYFRRQIDGRISNMRRSLKNKWKHVIIIGSHEYDESNRHSVISESHISSLDNIDDAITMKDFISYIRKNYANLLPLLLLSLNGIYQASDQAIELKRKVEHVYEMRRNLREILKEFCSGRMMKVGGSK